MKSTLKFKRLFCVLFRVSFVFCFVSISCLLPLAAKADVGTVDSSVTVTIYVCGNGVLEPGEECDDNNTVDGDGCNSDCETERKGGAIPKPPGPDEIEYYTKVILEGKAYPNASITILKDGNFLTTTKADSSADFEVKIKDITPGTYTFGLWAEDKNGFRSPTFTITFYVEAATTTRVSGILIPPTITISKTSLLKGEDLEIFGQSAPESSVRISIYSEKPLKEIFEVSVRTDLDGDWFYLFSTEELRKGNYLVRAKAITDQGLISIFSKTLSFEVVLVAPPIPPIPPIPPVPPVPPVPPIPPYPHPCPGADLNKDNRVNFIDFSILLYWWGRYDECADQNWDGVVDLIDFSIMMYWWTG